MAVWRNRIVSHGIKPAKEFLENPFNFRIHTVLQKDAMEGSLDELGWIEDVTENLITGHLINGHMRVALAYIRDNAEAVPYKQVELTPEEEKKALAILDYLPSMAERDYERLNILLQETRASDSRLEAVLADLRESTARLVFQAQPTEAHYETDPKILRQTSTEPSPGFISEHVTAPAVRHFQMFLSTEQYEFFMGALRQLSEKYQTQNATDTLLSALGELCSHA